jgi:hypothetical protein
MARSVRQRLDQLMAEPPVADLGYPPDHRVLAAVVLGLQLLADSIDAIEARLANGAVAPDGPEPVALPADIEGITAEIEGITAQVGTLAKLIKEAAEDR